jgi:hypothetical protein
MPFKVFAAGILSTADLDSYLMSQCIIRCTTATRPTITVEEGWHIYDTDIHQFLRYESGKWVQIGALDVVAMKPADEAYSTNVLHDDLHMQLPLVANTTYLFDSYICATGTVSGLHFIMGAWTVPAGTIMDYRSSHPTQGEEGAINMRFFQHTDTLFIYVTTPGTATQIEGRIVTGSVGGTVILRWRAGSGTVTTKQHSFIRARPIA